MSGNPPSSCKWGIRPNSAFALQLIGRAVSSHVQRVRRTRSETIRSFKIPFTNTLMQRKDWACRSIAERRQRLHGRQGRITAAAPRTACANATEGRWSGFHSLPLKCSCMRGASRCWIDAAVRKHHEEVLLKPFHVSLTLQASCIARQGNAPAPDRDVDFEL